MISYLLTFRANDVKSRVFAAGSVFVGRRQGSKGKK